MTTTTPATIRTVTLTVHLTDETLEGIMSTAFEGGIGYWARALDYSREGNNYLWLAVYEWEDFSNETGMGRDEMDEALERGEHFDRLTLIDYDVIARGIQLILSGEVGIRSDLYQQVMSVRIPGDEDIDADAADCIVQAGLFGELVYG